MSIGVLKTELWRKSPPQRRGWVRHAPGYSLIELLVTFIVMMILAAMSLPSITRAWRAYQLTSAASRVVDMIKSTRSDAVRQNTRFKCLIQQVNGIWWIGEDVDGSGTLDAGEPQVPLAGGPTLLAAGVAPNPASMGYPGAQVPAGSIGFDPRGGVDFGGGAPVVYVVYIGMANDTQSGFRAITVTPSGSTQVWLASSSGAWNTLY